jgi:hypothetical protein
MVVAWDDISHARVFALLSHCNDGVTQRGQKRGAGHERDINVTTGHQPTATANVTFFRLSYALVTIP